NIPGSYLTDSEKLKEYFKKTFDVTDEIFDALGDEKYQIKSYLAIGIVGLRSELSYVLSIDSTEDDAFDDFQTAKVLKDARLTEITHIQGAIEAAEEETDEEVAQVARTDSIEKQDNILPKVEIPEEILRELPPEGRKFFEALAEGKYPQISGVAFEIMGQTGIRRPNIDRFVYTLGMILKLLEVIIQKRYPLMKEVSKV
ncbi:MAG TPA: hypothetical protein ACFYD2_08515, partial [Candidatus Avalokitesvara rifleensis]|uniref:hypothetical protein n=1 Tax=Candidatus Avalokitesvara rifleensis TaxID=3367620 RepID=UPI0040282E56